ncbi:Protein of unknown function [Gryllus bimaculatus]|nr:Protein of unknown function [Gryllus bimaculatus]
MSLFTQLVLFSNILSDLDSGNFQRFTTIRELSDIRVNKVFENTTNLPYFNINIKMSNCCVIKS